MPGIYLYLNGEQQGPYLPGQLRSMLAEGTIAADTPAWQEGLAEWSTVGALLPPVPASGPPPVPPSAMPRPIRVAQPDSSRAPMIVIAVILGFLGLFIVSCLAGIALGPITKGIQRARENVAVQQARVIAMAMYTYAVNHHGNYPDGKTSTEVFQKLLDAKLIPSPALFYVLMPGKTPGVLGQPLTANNVCFDVTGGVTLSSSSEVPVVFTTGYSMTYSDGATASSDGVPALLGLAVAYKGSWSRFIRAQPAGGTVVSATFGVDGRQYWQLKP